MRNTFDMAKRLKVRQKVNNTHHSRDKLHEIKLGNILFHADIRVCLSAWAKVHNPNQFCQINRLLRRIPWQSTSKQVFPL
jgi:hypothetical protein